MASSSLVVVAVVAAAVWSQNLRAFITLDSEILLAQISVCLRFLAGVHVFEAAEIQIREQILDPCLLLDSGLRDYEIKLVAGSRRPLRPVAVPRRAAVGVPGGASCGGCAVCPSWACVGV
eukprot:COSAG01_NODE_7653_length_3113_cov_2.601858_3_plen_120_part_00